MTRGAYQIISETTEDRFDETDSLDEALRIARGLAGEGQANEPVSIEYGGRVIHQFVLTPNGVVDEATIRHAGLSQREASPDSARRLVGGA